MDIIVVVLLHLQSMLFDPYIGSALVVNVATLVASGVSLGQRNLFYAPLLVRDKGILRHELAYLSLSSTPSRFVDVSCYVRGNDLLLVGILPIRQQFNLPAGRR